MLWEIPTLSPLTPNASTPQLPLVVVDGGRSYVVCLPRTPVVEVPLPKSSTTMDYAMRLITEVRRYPELYDNAHKDFKNKEVKHAIWCNIAFKLRKECDEQSVKVVRMRWKSLRDSYVKEIKHKMALSTGQDIKPRKNWRYSNAMGFLAPHLAISFPTPVKSKDIADEKQDDMETYYLDLDNNSPDTSNTSNPNTHFLGALLDCSTKNQPPVEVSNENEVDSFFKGLADTVKKMSPINQVRIQKEVVNMVLGYKLKELQENV